MSVIRQFAEALRQSEEAVSPLRQALVDARAAGLCIAAAISQAQTTLRGVAEQFEPEQPLRDLLDIAHMVHGSPAWLTPEEYEAAIGRLASCPSPTVRDPRAKRCLSESAAAAKMLPATYLRRRVFPASVLLVIQAIKTPQRLQVGRWRWTDTDGRWRPRRPDALLPHQFNRWFAQALYAAATAMLLDCPYPAPAGELFDSRIPPVVFAAGKRAVLLSREQVEAAQCLMAGQEADDPDNQRLMILLAKASPRERQLLTLRLAGYSPADAAARMNIAPMTAYQLIHRLKDKAQGG